MINYPAVYGLCDPVVSTLTVDIILQFTTTAGEAQEFVIEKKNSDEAAVTVDWGDGIVQDYNLTAMESVVEHEYASVGTYTVNLISYSQNIKRVAVPTTSTDKLIAIERYWSSVITDMSSIFVSALNITTVTALFNSADLPQATIFDSCFRGWNNFDTELPVFFMRDAQQVTSMKNTFQDWSSYAKGMSPFFLERIENVEFADGIFYGWGDFNSDLPFEFFTNIPVMKSMSNAFRGWTSFNSTLNTGFMTNTPALTNVDYMCYDWEVFNQPLISNFMADVSGLEQAVLVFSSWNAFNQPLPAGFMSNLPNATSLRGLFLGWQSFDSQLNADLLANVGTNTGGTLDIASIAAAWFIFNQPLPDTFLQGPTLSNCQNAFQNWRLYNQPLPELFMSNPIRRGGAFPLSATFSGWNTYNQPLPDAFLSDVDNNIPYYTSCFESWSVYEYDMWVPDVSGALASVSGMYANSPFLKGNGNDLISQRTDWTTSGIGSHSNCFTGCTSLTDYDTIPSDWK